MVHCADRSDPGDLGYVLLQNFLAKFQNIRIDIL